jgi:hypothetical protein
MSKIESLAQKVKAGEISNKDALGELSNWWEKQRSMVRAGSQQGQRL